MIDQLIEIDTKIFLYLNNLGVPFWDNFWMFVTAKISWIPLYLAVSVALISRLGWRVGLLAISVLLLLLGFTDQMTNLFKHGFERLRPCHNLDIVDQIRLVKPHCGGRFGFISGHAGNSFAFAAGSSLILRSYFCWYPFVILIWAGMVSYSRIYIGVHYPLDIFFGACFGLLSGVFFYFLYTKVQRKQFLNLLRLPTWKVK